MFGFELDELISQTCEIVRQSKESDWMTDDELDFLVTLFCHGIFGALQLTVDFRGAREDLVLVKAMIKANYSREVYDSLQR